ncbi:MAG: sigma-70 family RNA polymerase sigma factor [Flavobacteriaceae bacterium]|nr:sigma-70 family RNA polymerase sigma factor [Flavobacteriaceae bacterium]MDZ4148732.1 sigma-70 family RNA polymerase sigma factor [Flavobacteriaceae bacterium]
MISTVLTDSELVRDYISGDESALEKLIHRHKQKIYAFIYSKVMDRDVTEDVFQDTFVKVIRTLKKGNYNEEGKFLPWVIRISHNLVIDHFRRNQRMPIFKVKDDFDILSVLSDGSLHAESQMIKDQIDVDLRKLIMQLPDDQREVLEMRLYRDLSFKEISEVTDVSINTALGRMRYALINLRKLIKKNNVILTD